MLSHLVVCFPLRAPNPSRVFEASPVGPSVWSDMGLPIRTG